MAELPQNWIECELQRLVDIINGYAFKSSLYVEKGYRIVRITNVQKVFFVDTNPKFYAPTEDLQKYELKGDDILLSLTGNVGRVCIMPQKFLPAYLNQRVGCLRIKIEKCLNYKYLFYQLSTDEFEKICVQNSRGNAQLNLGTEFVKTVNIKLPPLNEQKRIVEKLDKIIRIVDGVNARLDKIPTALKRARQSILNQAITGELTKDWREIHHNYNHADDLIRDIQDNRKKQYEVDCKKAKFTGNKTPKKLFLPEYKHLISSVQNWGKCYLANIFSVETGSTPLRSNDLYYKDGNIPWIKTGEVQNCEIYRAEEYITEKALKETNVKLFPVNTLLIAMYGEGKTRGQVGRMKINATTNQACAALVNSNIDYVLNEYVFYYCLSKYNELRRLAVGGNQPNLNLEKIKMWEIDIPPLEEQTEIVRRVKLAFEKLDKIELRYQKAKEYFDKLAQSILNKAFRGELVSQDPNDSPIKIPE